MEKHLEVPVKEMELKNLESGDYVHLYSKGRCT